MQNDISHVRIIIRFDHMINGRHVLPEQIIDELDTIFYSYFGLNPDHTNDQVDNIEILSISKTQAVVCIRANLALLLRIMFQFAHHHDKRENTVIKQGTNIRVWFRKPILSLAKSFLIADDGYLLIETFDVDTRDHRRRLMRSAVDRAKYWLKLDNGQSVNVLLRVVNADIRDSNNLHIDAEYQREYHDTLIESGVADAQLV